MASFLMAPGPQTVFFLVRLSLMLKTLTILYISTFIQQAYHELQAVHILPY
jgi:hypothetical protein